jgi:hypothetical protein
MRTKKLSVVLLFYVLLNLACAPAKKDIVIQYFDAYNKHQPGVVNLLLSDNITFTAIESFTLRGKEELKNLAEYDSTLHTELVYSNLTEAGDTVICQVSENNDWLAALGITSIRYDYAKFVVRHKDIWDIIVKMNDQSINEISTKLQPVIDWASNNKPDVLNDVMPDGEFIYDKIAAEMWLQLLQEYNAATGSK